MGSTHWKLGDRVVHANKPEWGVGEVRGAEGTTQDGRPCQRLTVRFDRAGVKVLSTAFAELLPADQFAAAPALPTGDADAAIDVDTSSIQERLVKLPDAATDPFSTRKARLKATLGLYRFSGTGASLLDWAASQTGMKDPLSSFSRHDLEKLFERFRTNLDAHLRRLVGELRREDPGAIAELSAAAVPAAQQALRRVDAMR